MTYLPIIDALHLKDGHVCQQRLMFSFSTQDTEEMGESHHKNRRHKARLPLTPLVHARRSTPTRPMLSIKGSVGVMYESVCKFGLGESQTPLSMWCGPGRQNPIRELHAKNLTVSEIREFLAAGKTSTGQITNISLGQLRVILRKMGLKPNRYSADYISLRQKAAGEARARGLTYREMVVEFNEKKLRRGKNKRQPWTARYINVRWSKLNRLQREREQKQSTGADLSEPVVLRKSA